MDLGPTYRIAHLWHCTRREHGSGVGRLRRVGGVVLNNNATTRWWLVGFWVTSKRHISFHQAFVHRLSGDDQGGNERVVRLVRCELALYHEQA